MKVKIVRLETTAESGTFGVMLINEKCFCVTVEPPFLVENTPLISAIPPGFYQVGKVKSPKFGDTFEVKDVKDRTNILFHSGNTKEHTHGCIILGERYGKIEGHGVSNGLRAVLHSRKAFETFYATLKDHTPFDLLIVNAF
jgi:hypothetical protein